MKITKTELLQIIKEEAGKLKKARTLIAEKKQIEKQLVELFGEEIEAEGWMRDNPLSKALGVKSTEQFDQDTLNDRILSHPNRKKFYQSILNNPKMASEYVKFWGTHDRPTDIPVWDEKTQTFIDKGLGAGGVGG